MNGRIKWILALMAICTLGVSALQFYWNYQNYKRATAAFRQSTSSALNVAVNKEMSRRHNQIATKFRHWLMDTSFVHITCDNHNRHKTTVFHLVDTHPLEPREKGVYFGINSFKQSLDHITPYAKAVFIEHFANNILKEDLNKGMVYNYTQRLGDSLQVVYKNCKADIVALQLLYKSELSVRGVNTGFKLYNSTHKVDGHS